MKPKIKIENKQFKGPSKAGSFMGDGLSTLQQSGSVEDQIEAVCEFVKAYEKRKFEIMHKGGKMLGVVFFMKDYCESLRMKPND